MINTLAKPNFFYGVVENRLDPLKLGRVQCRIVGVHTEQLSLNEETGEGIESSNLPWAYPALPISSASMNGIGESPLGPVEGTWVIGMTRDGDAYNDLVYFATLGGIPTELPRASEGFFDPNSKYPKASYLNEPDTNRLARNEKIDQTIVDLKRKQRTTGIPIALGGNWSQPAIPYAAVYPYNHVYESESGHIRETDDTNGAERTHEYHKAGTFKEIDKFGTLVEKIVKDKYTIVLGSDYIEVVGSCNIHVGGNATVMVGGDLKAEVKGNVTSNTHGDEIHTVGGNYTLSVGGNIVETAQRIDFN